MAQRIRKAAADSDRGKLHPRHLADVHGEHVEIRRQRPTDERLDRKWNDVLQELRAVQAGTQIITGFLLAVAFQPTFAELERYELTLYLVLVVLAATATMLGLAPVILHRQLFGQLRRRSASCASATASLLADLAVVSLLAAGVASLIFDFTLGRTAGFIALVVALVAVGAALGGRAAASRRRSSTCGSGWVAL